MRTVIILSLLALLAASAVAFGTEPVEIGGDFGTAWLNEHPYQSETTSDDDDSGLWSWGNVPSGMELVGGSLQSIYNDADDVDYADVAWLEEGTTGQPVSINGSSAPPAEMENVSSLSASGTSSDGNESGLWSWGNVPSGVELVNGSLQSIYNDADDVDYADIGWLEEGTTGQPVSINGSSSPTEMATAGSSSTFYSDDPWILAQHYERLFTTSSDYYG